MHHFGEKSVGTYGLKKAKTLMLGESVFKTLKMPK